MRRRFALAGLGATLAAGAARAQVAGRPAKVGMLYLADTATAQLDGFRERLAALGWVDGRNLTLIGSAGRGYEEVRAAAAGVVAGGVDVLVTRGDNATRAARAATVTVPIVAIAGSDLVAAGFAASLARPGGNVTGVSTTAPALTFKRVELLRECLPNLRRVATVYSPDNPGGATALQRLQEAGARFGFAIDARATRRLEDFGDAVAGLASGGPAALMPVTSTLFQTEPAQRRLAELALRHRMPSMFVEAEAARAGGLISYGVDIAAIWVRAAEYVDRILRGTKPGDLPIEEPSRFQLVVNLATARALGITLPPTVVARADEVIE